MIQWIDKKRHLRSRLATVKGVTSMAVHTTHQCGNKNRFLCWPHKKPLWWTFWDSLSNRKVCLVQLEILCKKVGILLSAITRTFLDSDDGCDTPLEVLKGTTNRIMHSISLLSLSENLTSYNGHHSKWETDKLEEQSQSSTSDRVHVWMPLQS